MKLYIAGKITGDKDYRSKFEAAEKKYTDEGYIVLNPAVLPGGMKPEDYMRVCFSMIDISDAVIFLEGYESSCGSLLEKKYCEYIGKPVHFQKAEHQSDDKIKSKDLCERCEHGEENCGMDCKKCEMWSKLDAACICDHIFYGTPCPYFRDKEESV